MTKEELFSDAEAAKTIEEIQPNLAQTLRQLVLAGQTPREIKQQVQRQAASGLITSLINQAAHRYITLLKPINMEDDEDGTVVAKGIKYRYNVIDNHGVARWQCHEHITEQQPTHQAASVAIRQWIAERANEQG